MTQTEFDFIRESLLLKCDNLLREIVNKMSDKTAKENEKGENE